MSQPKPLPREAWVVFGFVLGVLAGGGTVKVADFAAVAEVVCPEQAPEGGNDE